jgi:hypothetical protein
MTSSKEEKQKLINDEGKEYVERLDDISQIRDDLEKIFKRNSSQPENYFYVFLVNLNNYYYLFLINI